MLELLLLPLVVVCVLGGVWLCRRQTPPRTYVVIYDDAHHEGEDHGENYYGFFASEDDARRMFASLVGLEFDRYSNAHICEVVQELKI